MHVDVPDDLHERLRALSKRHPVYSTITAVVLRSIMDTLPRLEEEANLSQRVVPRSNGR